jgi:microsomal epoxide hydrolase
MAAAFAELMTRLGYERFASAGGDLGAVVSLELASRFSERLIGIELSSAVVGPPADFDPTRATPTELDYLERAASFAARGAAYQQIQSTRSLTLGYALEDSPSGLAAWILEKFRAWSDCQGDLETVYTRDELLTNVMLYWLTGTATSAARTYRETMGPDVPKDPATGYAPLPKSPVPTGYAVYPGDIMAAPRGWLEAAGGRVDRYTQMKAGGHFPAWEQPELFVEEVRTFFRELR